jgi:hypothetical protein
MRTQIWIIAAAFSLFGAIAWILTFFSPAYVALIAMGFVLFIIGAFSSK